MTSSRSELGVDDVTSRMAYHDESLPFALLWSEKAGCTSLLKWFAHHLGRLDEAEAHGEWIHHWEHDILKADPAYAERLVERLRAGLPVFKLVRSPFDRAVSSYLMLFTEPDDSDHFSVPLRAEIRQFVYGRTDVPYSFGFVSFLEWLATEDLSTVDDHLAPQTTPLDDLLGDVTYVRVDRFEADLRKIERRFGLAPADYAAVSSSAHHTSRTRLDGLDRNAVARLQIPVDMPDGFQIPPSDDFMSAEAVDLISRIYRADIDRYGDTKPGGRRSGRAVLGRVARRARNTVSR